MYKEHLKRNKQNKMDYIRGITLVALVITLVILIILATVTVNVAFGDGGLIEQAKLATEDTANSMEYEEQMIANLESYINDTLSGEITNPPEDKPSTDGSFNGEKGVNSPNIGANMELVVFDEGTSEWKKDETNSGYSYIDTSESGKENKSEWANAKVTTQVNGENVESYFVWIPRYAYKINGENDIDIVFIKGNGTEAAEEGKTCKYADDPTLNTSTDYIIHPAFTKNKDLGGGWDEELPGIWIGKYEAARSDTEGSTDGTATTIKVQPGITSFRNITIGEMYTYAKAYSTELKSHMLKNSEWGAVAYLTESKYGRNGTEVSINNNGTTYYTGGGAEKAYINNVLQSSTGNVYGIYDLSGNANEYVASYYNGSDANTASIGYGDPFASIGGTSDEYSTTYNSSGSSSASANYKYGDATYETSGWNGDSASFVSSRNPFFKRGGLSNAGSNAGVFYFYSYSRQRHQRLLLSPLPSSVMCNLLSEQKINFFQIWIE